MAARTITLPDAEATARFAARLGGALAPGDTLCLEGDIGAGKTHFARSLIQSHQSPPEDVPSPTFTLVQVYETQLGEVWHADLYRLTDPSEIVELGLTDAFETSICLIEWPDRLGELEPASCLRISFEIEGQTDARIARLTWSDDSWTQRINRIFRDDT